MLSDLLKMGAEPSKKCTAHSKRTGAPCNNAPVAGLTVCRMHGGATKAAREAARRRLDEAADRLAKKLLKIALDDGASEATQLAAIKKALDRAGLSAKTAVEVEVGVKPWEGLAEKIVGFATTTRAESRALRGIPATPEENQENSATSAPSDGEIVEAEIVDEPTEPRENVPAGTYRGDADDSSRGRPGPNTTPPGTGLMTFEEANRLANEANQRAGVYDRRYRR